MQMWSVRYEGSKSKLEKESRCARSLQAFQRVAVAVQRRQQHVCTDHLLEPCLCFRGGCAMTLADHRRTTVRQVTLVQLISDTQHSIARILRLTAIKISLETMSGKCSFFFLNHHRKAGQCVPAVYTPLATPAAAEAKPPVLPKPPAPRTLFSSS